MTHMHSERYNFTTVATLTRAMPPAPVRPTDERNLKRASGAATTPAHMVIQHMSDLASRLQSDLKDAVRSSDTTRRDVVRFLRAEIHNVEIERGRPLSDDEIVSVVQRQIKQRHDSIEQFSRGGRQDLVDAEKAQIAILEHYLPPQLSEEELMRLARDVVGSLGASGPGDMGRVISELRERVGQRASGSAVATAARTVLVEQGNRAKSG